jgi:hypothetical protein
MLTESQNQLMQIIRAHNIGGALVSGFNGLIIILYGGFFGLLGFGSPSSSSENTSFFATLGVLGFVFLILGIAIFGLSVMAIVLSILIKKQNKWVWYLQIFLLICGSLNLFMFYTMPISIYLLIKYAGKEYKDYYCI